MKIYIAGPMTGLPDFNRGAFFTLEQFLRESRPEQKHVLLNPAVLPDGLEHGDYMEICIPMVKAATTLILLPGWERSRGAQMELAFARFRKMTVIEAFAPELCPPGVDCDEPEVHRITRTIASDRKYTPMKECTFVLAEDSTDLHKRVLMELL